MTPEQIMARLDSRQHQFDLNGRVIESFRWAGIHCVILPGAVGVNGYARLPKRVARRLRGARHIAERLGFDRRLSYVDWSTRWVGFDTNGPGDVWSITDAQYYSIDPQLAVGMCKVQYRNPPPAEIRRAWTLDIVRMHTRCLAERIDLHRHGIWPLWWRPLPKAASEAKSVKRGV